MPTGGAASGAAARAAAAAGSPASSVDSAELQSLLKELDILPAPPSASPPRPATSTKRRFVVDTDSEAESSPARPQSSPRLEAPAGAAAAELLRAAAVAAAAPPPPAAARQQPAAPLQQRLQQPRHEPEVIDLLDSESDAEAEWRIAAPATSQKQRRVVDSESESDADADDEEGEGEEQQGDSSDCVVVEERGAPLLPCFAAIPSLAGAADAAQPPAKAPSAPKAAAAGAGAAPSSQQTAAAPRGAAQAACPPPPPGARPQLSAAAFKKQREALCRQLFDEFNAAVFSGRLPADLEIKWNARLLTTAGLTHYRRDIPEDPYAPPIYTARVELSSKVLDSLAKLERTLCHELCHVAAWLLDHTAKPPHGPVFKRWADAAMRRYTHLDITTCHAYEIFYPFRWQCSNDSCLQTYGRHSNSIDVTKKVCGACRAPLSFLGRFKPDGTPAKQRPAASGSNRYAQFVKENHAEVKAQLPAGTPQSVVMQKLSERWAALGGSTATSASASVSVSAAGSGSASEGGGQEAASRLMPVQLQARLG